MTRVDAAAGSRVFAGTGGLRSRFVLMLGGEAVQSAFHFGLNVGLVRSLSQADYGLFAIVFLVGGIGLTYVRSLAGVPASTFVPRRHGQRAARAYDVTFGSGAVAISALFGLGVAFALWLVMGTAAGALAGGAFVALWCLRSYLRLALFAKRRPLEAGLGDLAFALSGTVLAWWFVRGEGLARIDGVLVALAVAHAVGSAVSVLALRDPVRVDFGASTRRRYRGLRHQLAWSFVGVTTTNLQSQGQTLLVALVAGPEAYAPIAAALVLFAPLRLSAGALLNMAQPELAAAMARRDTAAARRLVLVCAAVILGAALACGAVLFAAFPSIASHLFASKFAGQPLGLITALLWLVATVSLGYAAPRILLEAVGAFRFLAAVSAVTAVVGAAAVSLLLVLSTPAWSVLGLLLSETLVLAACVAGTWRRLRPARPSTERSLDPCP